jgi:hypothetical protein
MAMPPWRRSARVRRSSKNTPVGTLVVDIFDSSRKKLIWRGAGSSVLSEKLEKNEKKLEHTVAEMFKHFPPPSKG